VDTIEVETAVVVGATVTIDVATVATVDVATVVIGAMVVAEVRTEVETTVAVDALEFPTGCNCAKP